MNQKLLLSILFSFYLCFSLSTPDLLQLQFDFGLLLRLKLRHFTHCLTYLFHHQYKAQNLGVVAKQNCCYIAQVVVLN